MLDGHKIVVQSYKGPYAVRFFPPFFGLEKGLTKREHLIIDTRVAELYSRPLKEALQGDSVLKIQALEPNKSLEKMAGYVTYLSDHGVKRGHTLIAVGGGIIQDIVAFLAAILFRGVAWRFYPTTLLAQADSCIGSKSSINVGRYKNQVGTFTPPEDIVISLDVLDTLENVDLRSGIGEILKVHLIAGWNEFRGLAKDYPSLASDKTKMQNAICRSLEIKKHLIERDEFDKNERLILNYGHTFGHAIESATNYEIPHGIAVTIGMDMANFISCKFGFITHDTFDEIHSVLKQNYAGLGSAAIELDGLLRAIAKDKKNVDESISLILSRGPGKIFRDLYPNDERFRLFCEEYLNQLKN